MFQPEDRVQIIIDSDPQNIWADFMPSKLGNQGTVKSQLGSTVYVLFDGWCNPTYVVENTIALVDKKWLVNNG